METATGPRKKLGDRILLLLVTMTVVAPMVLGVAFFLVTRNQAAKTSVDLTKYTEELLEKEISGKNEELAARIAVMLEEKIRPLQRILLSKSIIPGVATLDPKQSKITLKRLVYKNPAFLEVSIADKEGREIAKESRHDIDATHIFFYGISCLFHLLDIDIHKFDS